MNKTTIAAITAALLLAAVLCTAGCVEAPSDPIVGDWVAETDSSVSYAVFENGGTGTIYFGSEESSSSETESRYSESSSSQTATVSFNWKADGGSAYTLTFADGTTETAVLNTEHGLMTIEGVEYQKYPNGYSGASIHPESPSGMMDRVEYLETQMGTLSGQVNNLEVRVDNLSEDTPEKQELKDQTNNLREQMRVLFEQISQVKVDVWVLTKIDNPTMYQSMLGSAQEKVSDLETQMKTLSDKVDNLQNQISELEKSDVTFRNS